MIEVIPTGVKDLLLKIKSGVWLDQIMRITGLLLVLIISGNPVHAGQDRIVLPRTGFEATDLAIIVNDADPLSIKIANYYQRQRNIPTENLIHVRFEPGKSNIPVKQFQKILKTVYDKTPANVQAYALTWALPFRVGCMSITTAFTMGYSEVFCATGCKQTQASAYYNSNSRAPYNDLGIRPTMAIAANNFKLAKALIDRGVKSDRSFPTGTGYLLSTSDKARNTRANLYPLIAKQIKNFAKVELVNSDSISGKKDVLFYFTGKKYVEKLDTNRFLPGAIADHLTSAGGVLNGTNQMSSLRWLEAGATGSYGAVTEPCNFPMKFPHPGIVMGRYTTGETLIEAYWKSVLQPGQGIFIGEPLANPYGGYHITVNDNEAFIKTRSMHPGLYILLSGSGEEGPFIPVRNVYIKRWGNKTFSFPVEDNKYYRLIRSEKQPTIRQQQELPSKNPNDTGLP